MSCNPNNKPQTQAKEESSGGFFSWFIGGDSSSGSSDNGKCPGGCGMDKCNCNCALKDHLKECCGFGQLPALITKDTCPVPAKSASNCEAEANKSEQCVFPPVQTTCAPPDEKDKPATATACSVDPNAKPKCSMPDTDTSPCIPTWICPPVKSGVREYPAPAGVVVLPLSASPRIAAQNNAASSGKCGQFGTATTVEEKPKSQTGKNKDCPMYRQRCGDKKEKEEKSGGGGFDSIIAKIGALFGGKAEEFQQLCQRISKEAAAQDACKCNDCAKDRAKSTVQNNFQNCIQSKTVRDPCKYDFQNPTQTFQDFKVPPGTEVKRQPKGCEIPTIVEKVQEVIPPIEEIIQEEIQPVVEKVQEESLGVESAPVQENIPVAMEIQLSVYEPKPLVFEASSCNCPPLDAFRLCDDPNAIQKPPLKCLKEVDITPFHCLPPIPVDSELESEPPAEPAKVEIVTEDPCAASEIKTDDCCCEFIVEKPCPTPEIKYDDKCCEETISQCEETLKPKTAAINECEEIPKPEIETVAVCKCEETPKPKSAPISQCEETPKPKSAPISQCEETPKPILQAQDNCQKVDQVEIKKSVDENVGTEETCTCESVYIEEKVLVTSITVETCQDGKPEQVDITLAVTKDLSEGVEGPCRNALCVVVEPIPQQCEQITTEISPAASTVVLEIQPALEIQEQNNKSFLDDICKCQSCIEARGGSPADKCSYQIPKDCCSRCGENRGDNSSCPMCRFVTNVRNSCPPKATETVEDDEESCDCPRCTGDICDSDVFDLNENGKPNYEGGMCLTRAQYYLWKSTDGPTFARYSFEGQKFKGYGVDGEEGEGEEMDCTCEEHMRMMEEMKAKKAYHGGMELPDAQKYLWARAEPVSCALPGFVNRLSK